MDSDNQFVMVIGGIIAIIVITIVFWIISTIVRAKCEKYFSSRLDSIDKELKTLSDSMKHGNLVLEETRRYIAAIKSSVDELR